MEWNAHEIYCKKCKLPELQPTKQCVNKWITLHTYFSKFRRKKRPIDNAYLVYQPVLLYAPQNNDLAGFP